MMWSRIIILIYIQNIFLTAGSSFDFKSMVAMIRETQTQRLRLPVCWVTEPELNCQSVRGSYVYLQHNFKIISLSLSLSRVGVSTYYESKIIQYCIKLATWLYNIKLFIIISTNNRFFLDFFYRFVRIIREDSSSSVLTALIMIINMGICLLQYTVIR